MKSKFKVGDVVEPTNNAIPNKWIMGVVRDIEHNWYKIEVLSSKGNKFSYPFACNELKLSKKEENYMVAVML